MSQNNSMSFESSNQFMQNQNNPPPSFNQFMQACFQNPTFFESMKHFYISQAQTNPNQPNNTSAISNQSNYQPPPTSYVQPREVQERKEYNRQEQFEKNVKVKLPESKRKPANPLAKFIPAENIQTEKANQPLSKPSQPLKAPPFDDRPIKTNYAQMADSGQNFNLNAIKENQSVNIAVPARKVMAFDDIPIKGVKEHQLESYYKEEQQSSPPPASYNMDDRPLTGCSKDFKELVRQKFPNAIVPNEDEIQTEKPEKKEHRQFLKRGSRQHLSSAMNKSKQPKNKDSSMNKSQLEEQKDRSVTPRRNMPEGRSTSQNRVLGKKNPNQVSERVIARPPVSNNSDESFEENISRKPKAPPLNRQKNIKQQPKSVKTSDRFDNQSGLMNSQKKKKTKNVFNDDSDQSSQSEEEKAPFFKVPQKKVSPVFNKASQIEKSQEIEVIEGVFLTQEQLDEIVEKFGKVKEVVRQNDSEKVAALKRKYNQMAALMQEEKQQTRQALEREKQQFQRYKSQQMNKIKNQRRVMQRQVKSSMGGANLQKQKEQLQQLRQELQKQRQDFKKKEKNNRIILQKYKKQNEDLKNRLQRMQIEKQTKSITSKRSTGNIKNEEDDKLSVTKSNTGTSKAKKVEEDLRTEEVSYKDIKKGQKIPEQKETKLKYDFEEDNRAKNKSISVKKEPIENQWASHKFNSQSDNSEPEIELQEEEEETSNKERGSEWSPAMKLSDLCKINLSIKMVTDQMIKSLFRYQNNLEYIKYQQSLKSSSRTVVNTTRNARNDYTAKVYSDRSKELIYDNGTKKVNFQNGYSLVYFKNGDIKQTLPDKTVLYYFKQKEVDQITLPNGINIYRFQNNQVEFHFQNGYIEIRHPDGTIKVLGGQHMKR